MIEDITADRKQLNTAIAINTLTVEICGSLGAH